MSPDGGVGYSCAFHEADRLGLQIALGAETRLVRDGRAMG